MSNVGNLLRIAPLLLAWCLGACVGGLGLAAAEKPPRGAGEAKPRESAATPSERAERESLSAEAREAAALNLVRRHLPQLNALLKTLRSDAPEQYERAISDLARQARRLEASQRRDPRLFEIELEILKRQTRVDLGVARLQLRDDSQTRQQLRRALSELQQARRARLEYERDQLDERLERLEQQRQMVEERLAAPFVAAPEWVDKTYKNLLRRAGRTAEATPAEKNDAKAAEKNDAKAAEKAAAKPDGRAAVAGKADGNQSETAGSPSR